MDVFVGLLGFGLLVVGAVAIVALSVASRALAQVHRLEATVQRLTAPRVELPLEEAANAAAPPARDDVALETKEKKEKVVDWEGLIGVRLFAWLGGMALFVGLAFFLRYSIQENLIAPPLRVALGGIVGALALFGGDYLRSKADRAGQAISGSGVAISYASLYAARTLYDLLPVSITFAGMALVTVVAGLIAVRKDAPMLAILGLLGGFMTPFLLSSGDDRPVALFVYVALLDAGILAVAVRRQWPGLALLGLGSTTAVYGAWAYQFLDAARVPYALLAAAILASIFALPRWRDTEEGMSRNLVRATAVLASGIPFVLVLILSGTNVLRASPFLLVGYLAILEAGAWFTGARTSFAPLLPIASGLTAFILAVRASDDLFPSQRVPVLAAFALLPLLKTGAWFLRRSKADAPSLRLSACIALAGSMLIVVRVLSVEMHAGGPAPITEIALFSFAHAAGLGAMGVVLGWGAGLLGAQALAVGTLLLLFGVESREVARGHWPLIVVSMLACWALPFAIRTAPRDRLARLSAGVALILHFPIFYGLLHGAWGDGPLGAAALACAVLALVSGLGGIALLFVTAAIPIWFDNEWLTAAWAFEALALAWWHTRQRHVGLLAASALLATAVVVRLLANPLVWDYHPRSGTPILNWELYTFGLPALAILLAPRWLRASDRARALKLPTVYAGAGIALLFVLLNVEIADFYSTGTQLSFHLSQGGFRQDMTYSLGWGLFALGLLGVGIARDSRALRIGSLVVSSLTAAKVTLHDLWALGSLYRVASFVGLAFALLAVSFFMQRYVLRSAK
ncbi:DUF2339 domain-containing protein [Pendulispora rubella]|uniref:DUF2339 domain-containing protein n=1 Tax=Pendulispora rubella TaxID=2741070 RepID=A0ABZ2KSD1_9BACT